MFKILPVTLGLGLFAVSASGALAQISDNVVRIGVLDDMSGPYADIQGPGDVVSVKMAVEDFGGTVLTSLSRFFPETHEQGGCGSSDRAGVVRCRPRRCYLGARHSAVALAVQDITRQKNRIDIVAAAGSTDLTGKACSPNGVHWVYDTYALANGTAGAIMRRGGADTWFFITTDYAFGHSLERDAAAVVKKSGGKVVGPCGSFKQR